MTTIPLSKLIPAKTNVRKTGTCDGIDELAASIAAHGLLASLVVKKATRGKFAVIAGQRRYLALIALARADRIPSDLPVSCNVIDDGVDATEIGLAENVVRIAMHPADQFEAFRGLIDKGATAADVAGRFGVTEALVAKRIRLGRVSPRILDDYRAGKLGLEQVQAFTVSDDHAAQERVFDDVPGCSPHSIRRALTEGEIPATDKHARFIGLDAYEAAGGTVKRDLFDDRNSGYLLDANLLDRLVREGLETQAEAVRGEGWSWVEVHPDVSYDLRCEFDRLQPDEVQLPDAEAAELEALHTEYDALSDGQYDHDGEEISEISERLDQIEERIDALNASAQVWSLQSLNIAGAVLTIAADGSVVVERGLVRSDNLPAQMDEADDSLLESSACQIAGLPATLTLDLTAQKTAALRTLLAQQPDVALAAVTHTLARQAFYSSGGASCLDMMLRERPLQSDIKEPAACSGLFGFDMERGKWTERLPADAGDLFAWCLRQTQETLQDLLAISAAHSVDAVRSKGVREDAPALLHADALADALQLDMHSWFSATAENYFARVSRTFIMDALGEAGVSARTRSWAKLKKSELAALAAREIHGTGWLPQPLRRIAGTQILHDAQTDMPVAAAA